MRQLLAALAMVAVLWAASQARGQTAAPMHALVPENAFSQASEAPPQSSSPLESREFERRYREGNLVLARPERMDLSQPARDEENRALLQSLNTLLKDTRPQLLQKLISLPPGIDTAHSFADKRDIERTVLLLGSDPVWREVLRAQAMLRGVGGAENQLQRERLERIATLPLPIDTRAAATVACDDEEGSGPVGDADDGDQTGPRCAAEPLGLGSSAVWPLKAHTTCVRNQGTRSTSPAFALTAAAETWLARTQKRHANLSEQHLQAQLKLRWSPSARNHGESETDILSTGWAVLTGYRFHFEDVWLYNPSYDRIDPRLTPETDDDQMPYGRSCTGYSGRHCSDTAHQARMSCAVHQGLRYCGFEAPMPLPSPTTLRGATVLFDVLRPEPSLADARRLLDTGVPVILTAVVNQGFGGARANGYVREQSEAGSPPTGGHTLLLTGFVSNESLPMSAPRSAGGGYFIAKNSWGRCSGDAGFLYLDYDWVLENAVNLTAVF